MAWLDLARTVSVFAVVILHVASSALLAGAPGSADWWAANLYDSATRWSVPMLVMISGALLLVPEKCADIPGFYRRRAGRIAIPLVFWTLVYLAWTWWRTSLTPTPVSGGELLVRAATGFPYYHLWYLYMLVGLYLVAPFVQRTLAACTRRELLLLLAISFVLAAIWQAYSRLVSDDPGVFTTWFLRFLPFFVFGHYIRRHDFKVSRAVLLAVFWVSIGTTFAGFWFLFDRVSAQAGFYVYAYLSITVIPMSISAMLLIESFGENLPGQPGLLTRLAGVSFGIYLLHPLVIEVMRMITARLHEMPGLVSIPLIATLAFIGSAGVSALMMRMPILKKTV